MAIRFQAAIDNSVAAIQNGMDIRVKNAQEEMQRLLDKIMKHKDDMVDIIDTWNYIKNKKLDKYFNKFLVYSSDHIRMIGVNDNSIVMRFNNWKSEGGGPYDWYVIFDSENVKIRINEESEVSTVKDMISKAYYNVRDNRVIMPIPNKFGSHDCHEYTKPMSALSAFAERIGEFCDLFFKEVKEIALK